ncbi:MAG: hypothetical protein ABI618_05695 [Nitrospirota bacterium]
MRYRPTSAWLAVFALMLVAASVDIVYSAPRRPSNSASACSISADKFNQLAAKNSSGAAACRGMADNAQAHGGSFSFMCDSATGEISCCNDSSCVSLGQAMRGKLPGLRPEQMPGSMQMPPPPPGGKPGMAPLPGGTVAPQIR